MLAQDAEGRTIVVFRQDCGSTHTEIRLSLDSYLFLVKQSKNIEQLRCLIFEHCERESVKIARARKAVAG